MLPKEVIRREEGIPSIVIAQTSARGGLVEVRRSARSHPNLSKRGNYLGFRVPLDMAELLDNPDIPEEEKERLLDTLSVPIEDHEGYEDPEGLRRVKDIGVVVMNTIPKHFANIAIELPNAAPLYKEFQPRVAP
jgi:hypothetical protein